MYTFMSDYPLYRRLARNLLRVAVTLNDERRAVETALDNITVGNDLNQRAHHTMLETSGRSLFLLCLDMSDRLLHLDELPTREGPRTVRNLYDWMIPHIETLRRHDADNARLNYWLDVLSVNVDQAMKLDVSLSWPPFPKKDRDSLMTQDHVNSTLRRPSREF